MKCMHICAAKKAYLLFTKLFLTVYIKQTHQAHQLIFFFGGGGGTHFHSVTTQTQAVWWQSTTTALLHRSLSI